MQQPDFFSHKKVERLLSVLGDARRRHGGCLRKSQRHVTTARGTRSLASRLIRFALADAISDVC